MIIHQDFNSKGNYHCNYQEYRDIKMVPHFHRNYELIYVAEGRLSATVNQQTIPLEAGDFALILSNQTHAFESVGNSLCRIAVFSESFVPKFASLVRGKQGKTARFGCTPAVSAFVRSVMADPQASDMMRKACFYAACDEYIREVDLLNKQASDTRLGEILDYMAEHYQEDITLESISAAFGYEYHYMSRILVRDHNFHFKQMLREYRIEAALELLESGERKIIDIALDCGFQSVRTFNHAFREIMGVSPTEYLMQKQPQA